MGKIIKGIALGLGFFLLAGCESGGDEPNINEKGFYARFDPSNGVIPFPNDLLFNGTTDYTLNIPVTNPADYSDPKVALNTLDGFSTTAPITAEFSSAIDGSSVIAGQTVRMFEVSLAAPSLAVTDVVRELTSDEFAATLSSADPHQTTLAVLPKRPLAPQTGYMVVLTNGIKGQDGSSASSELPYALAKSETSLVDGSYKSLYKALDDSQAQALEPLRQLTNLAETAVEAYSIAYDEGGSVLDLPSSDIVLSWSFKTQSVENVLDLALDAVDGSDVPSISASPFPLDTGGVVPGSPGAALIYTGTLDTEYLLTAASVSDPTAPLNEFWHNSSGSFLNPIDPAPVSNGSKTMPVLITVPKAPATAFGWSNGWPVVIFQHGITRNRTDLLAIADGLASAGLVGIAIDLPLHGVTTADNPFYDGTNENTFNLDFVNNVDGSPGPDGATDDSGTHFINLANLLVTRDNMRQAVVDLAALHHTLPQLDTSFGGSLDTDQVYFVGHSLGGIIGSVFLHYFDGTASSHGHVQDAVLAMPGGGIAKLLDGSPTFGPKIAAGLAGHGLVKGTPDYESYMGAAQTVIDPVDPLNYAAYHASGTSRGILLFEVVGGNASLPDQVIPNNVLPGSAPGTVPSLLSGTDPMAALMGLTSPADWWDTGVLLPNSKAVAGENINMLVRYNAGHHGSLLTPNDAGGNPDTLSADVYMEMLNQTIGFLATGGNTLLIHNDSVLSSQ